MELIVTIKPGSGMAISKAQKICHMRCSREQLSHWGLASQALTAATNLYGVGESFAASIPTILMFARTAHMAELLMFL